MDVEGPVPIAAEERLEGGLEGPEVAPEGCTEHVQLLQEGTGREARQRVELLRLDNDLGALNSLRFAESLHSVMLHSTR